MGGATNRCFSLSLSVFQNRSIGRKSHKNFMFPPWHHVALKTFSKSIVTYFGTQRYFTISFPPQGTLQYNRKWWIWIGSPGLKMNGGNFYQNVFHRSSLSLVLMTTYTGSLWPDATDQPGNWKINKRFQLWIQPFRNSGFMFLFCFRVFWRDGSIQIGTLTQTEQIEEFGVQHV